MSNNNRNNNNNKIIVAVVIAVAVIAIVVAAIVSSKPDSKSAVTNGSAITNKKKDSTESEEQKILEAQKAPKEQNVQTKAPVAPTEEPERVTPTFVYFVTQEDEAYASFMETVEKLKVEFNGKINFDLRDLDKNPEEATNFSLVVGNTPAVIMLDIYNNPCAFNLSNPDEATLRATIQKALGE